MSDSEAGRGDRVVTPHIRDFASLENTLHGWLSRKMPEVCDLATANFSHPRGAGLSHETILFDVMWNENGAPMHRGMVIRIKPSDYMVFHDDMFSEQFKIMRVLHQKHIVPIAEPLWFEQDPTILGAPFFVMEKVHGRVAVSFPPYAREGWLFDLTAEERSRVWRAAVIALGHTQRLPLSDASFLDPEGRFPDGFEQEWDRWRRYFAWTRNGENAPFLETIWSLLEKSRPTSRQPGIVWGDARLGNVMINDRLEVEAVMDWEQPSLGGALHDIAWWICSHHMATEAQGLANPEGMGDREQTIALWSEVTGIDVTEIEWYERFAYFKMACLAYHMFRLRPPPGANMDRFNNPPSRVLADLYGLAPPEREAQAD